LTSNKYRLIYGVDPDSKAHGVAIFFDGQLKELMMLTLVELIEVARVDRELGYKHTLFSIEDTTANKFVYRRNTQSSKALQSNIAMRIGMCQQSQVELMRVLDSFDIPYVLHKPTVKNWADEKALFMKVTGWKGSSNVDTRSAAYMGFLAAK